MNKFNKNDGQRSQNFNKKKWLIITTKVHKRHRISYNLDEQQFQPNQKKKHVSIFTKRMVNYDINQHSLIYIQWNAIEIFSVF